MKILLMAAIGLAMVVGFAAGAAELPGFELMGFPITWHQVAVMGASGVQEQSLATEYAGMPASPHQIAVLTPRQSVIAQQKALKLTTVGLTSRY